MMLDDLFLRYAGMVGERQIKVQEYVRGVAWGFDSVGGLLNVGEYNFAAQLLGSYSFSGKDWLWVWGNAEAGCSGEVMEHAFTLKSFGDRHGVRELAADGYTAPFDIMHTLGVIAAGITNSAFYYIGDYGSGQALLTIPTCPFSLEADDHEVVFMFLKIVAWYDLSDHKEALRHYLEMKGFTLGQDTEKQITGVKGQLAIQGIFDKHGRLRTLAPVSVME